MGVPGGFPRVFNDDDACGIQTHQHQTTPKAACQTRPPEANGGSAGVSPAKPIHHPSPAQRMRLSPCHILALNTQTSRRAPTTVASNKVTARLSIVCTCTRRILPSITVATHTTLQQFQHATQQTLLPPETVASQRPRLPRHTPKRPAQPPPASLTTRSCKVSQTET